MTSTQLQATRGRSAHRLALVVPTKDRPDDLHRMLVSVRAQTYLPDQIVIVDGSDPDIHHIVAGFPELRVDYVRIFPPSLSQQRNAGMQNLRPEITLAGYLDDDVVLEPGAIEAMLKFWDNASPDIGGAAFNITNSMRPRWQGLKSLFGIDGKVPGKVLASGFPTTFGSQLSDIYTEWLYGGATVWRREVIEKFSYDEWFLGTGFLEDVDFSFSVRRAYRLALVSAARLAHYSRPVRLENERLLGKWQVVNRMYFVRKHRDRGLSVSAAWIASLALLVLNIGIGLLRADPRYLSRAKGNLAGITSELAGRRERVGGHLK